MISCHSWWRILSKIRLRLSLILCGLFLIRRLRMRMTRTINAMIINFIFSGYIPWVDQRDHLNHCFIISQCLSELRHFVLYYTIYCDLNKHKNYILYYSPGMEIAIIRTIQNTTSPYEEKAKWKELLSLNSSSPVNHVVMWRNFELHLRIIVMKSFEISNVKIIAGEICTASSQLVRWHGKRFLIKSI